MSLNGHNVTLRLTRSMPDSYALRAAAVGRQSPLRGYLEQWSCPSGLLGLQARYVSFRW
jgi:hypothetical protein